MFTELNNVLDISADEFPTGKNIAVLEGDTDGCFFIHHFISMAIKTSKKLCLITANQSVNHYNNVANKLGVNLVNERNKGSVIIIELLKDLGQWMISTESNTKTDSISEQEFSRNILKDLYVQIRTCIATFSNDDSFVIIDDLSPLLSIGLDVATVNLFVQYMSTFVRQRRQTCVVQLLHCGFDIRKDKGVAVDDEVEQVARQLCHMAHTVAMVNGLPTGYCKDVHGQIEVSWRDTRSVDRRPARRMQFKIHDKTVKLFPLGLSAAAIGL